MSFVPVYSTDEIYVGNDTSKGLTAELERLNQTAGTPGPAGADGQDGQDGADGADGITPHIGDNGNWFIGESDTGVAATGPQGPTGATGATGPQGPKGDKGDKGDPGSDATVTAAGVLELIKTVDGAGSGLDADTLDGKNASDFATTNHTHNGGLIAEHTGSPYAKLTVKDTKLETRVYKNASTTADFGTTIADYDADGKRDVMILCRNNALPNKVYMSVENDDGSRTVYYLYGEHHKPTAEDVGALPSSGDANVAGVLKVQGAQAIYNNGSRETFGSGKLETYITGTNLYSRTAISVASDERLKDVREIDKARLINFMKQIKFVEYALKDDIKKTPHLGVLAQQLISIDAEIARYFVSMGEDGFYSVDYAALGLLAMLALQ